MKKRVKHVAILLSLVASLMGCSESTSLGESEVDEVESEKESSSTIFKLETSENNEEDETKEISKKKSDEIDFDSIEIDWNKLSGYVFYEAPGESQDLFQTNPEMYLVLNIPEDMDKLYYSENAKYSGHKNIKLLLNGEEVPEKSNEEGSNWRDVVQVVRTSNRIIFRAQYKLDGTLSIENYDIEDPDGVPHHFEWDFTDDEEFMEKKLDIYKTLGGFYWFPSKDITVRRGDSLEWDLNAMPLDIPAYWNTKVNNKVPEFRARDSHLSVRDTYKTKPDIDYCIPYRDEEGYISITLPSGVSEKEFLDELYEQGLYLRVVMNDEGNRMIKLIDYKE